jgi:hypothetical protein
VPKIADGLLVVGDPAVTVGVAKFDVFVDRHRFDYLESEPVRFDCCFQSFDLVDRPDLADGDVVNGRDDSMHPRNLADVPEWYRIAFPKPPK